MNSNQPKPAEEQPLELPTLPEWKTNNDIPVDVWDEAIMFDADDPVAEWLVITRRQLFAALRSNREMKAQLADYEKLVLEKVIELGIAPSPEHENEWRNVRAEAAEAKLRDVSEAMKEKCDVSVDK